MRMQYAANGVPPPFAVENLDSWCALVRTELLDAMTAHARELGSRIDKGAAILEQKIERNRLWCEGRLQQVESSRGEQDTRNALIKHIERALGEEREARALVLRRLEGAIATEREARLRALEDERNARASALRS